ncbi:carbohydrate binding protein [Micromonospora olivasterospora]|uniref:Carbohydrate binding protein n=2 Tax=Micromonospora olivasterospora TaxID=1880 RepID=A0A562IFE5_MICOL|nr:carbohydrate binding protein [Micromonospora olivasterospora]
MPALARPATAAPTPTGNLIINGTFDNGSTEPWWTRLAETRTTVQSGQLRIQTAGRAVRTYDDLVGHFEFGVTAGQRYRLRFAIFLLSVLLHHPMEVQRGTAEGTVNLTGKQGIGSAPAFGLLAAIDRVLKR